MKKVRRTSFHLGMAVFLALLFPGSAFAATNNGTATSNDSAFDVSIQSSGSGTVEMQFDRASIDNTGPDSVNEVKVDVNENTQVVNDNTVQLDLGANQEAVSGNATVSGNTTGGSAVTGDARNTNTTRVEVAVDNTTGPCNCNVTPPVTPPQPGGQGGGPVGGQGGSQGGGVVLGVATDVQPTGRGGGQVLGSALPAQLPATGPTSSLGLIIALLASALTYTVLLRRQKLQQASAGTL